jgi:hypothetical protein
LICASPLFPLQWPLAITHFPTAAPSFLTPLSMSFVEKATCWPKSSNGPLALLFWPKSPFGQQMFPQLFLSLLVVHLAAGRRKVKWMTFMTWKVNGGKMEEEPERRRGKKQLPSKKQLVQQPWRVPLGRINPHNFPRSSPLFLVSSHFVGLPILYMETFCGTVASHWLWQHRLLGLVGLLESHSQTHVNLMQNIYRL